MNNFRGGVAGLAHLRLRGFVHTAFPRRRVPFPVVVFTLGYRAYRTGRGRLINARGHRNFFFWR
jgi:hypothetical protein